MCIGEPAKLRNAVRHSREVTTIMRNDGEAATGWFKEAIAATATIGSGDTAPTQA